jgi:hypothetical protein
MNLARILCHSQSRIPGRQVPSGGLEIHRTFMTRTGGTLDMEKHPQGELVVLKTQKSLAGDIENVVIQNLLPADGSRESAAEINRDVAVGNRRQS